MEGREEGPEGAGGPPERAGGSPWIEVIEPGVAEGELAEVYERIGGRRGPAAILSIQSLHPSGLEDHLRLYRTLMFGPSPISRAERESIAVVVSGVNGCFY